MTQHFVRFLFAVITACAAFVASATQWQTIVPAQAGLLNASGQLVDGNDAALTDSSGEPLIPKCVAPEDMGGPFRFFVQAGDPDKLLLFHSGGGACWNAATCASGLGLIPGVARSYSPVIFETPELLAKAGGVLDPEQSTNPFAKWTKVYIPYCTGDVGWGNRDMHYGLQLPDGRPFPISHRGYANVRTVTEWLKRHFQATGSQPRKVVVSGSSAGGYAAIGTLFNETVDVVGRSADMSVIGDSANGVVTDGFLQSARQAWGFEATLPAHVLAAVNQGAEGLPVRVYTTQTQWHRSARFGQFQNAYDLVQARVLNIMKHPDQPALWSDPLQLAAALAEWTIKARASVLATSLNNQYRFYTAAGFEHVVLQEIDQTAGFGFCSDHFATEDSARTLRGPLAFREWTKDMANRQGLNFLTDGWKNATCFPNCNVPPRCPPTP